MATSSEKVREHLVRLPELLDAVRPELPSAMALALPLIAPVIAAKAKAVATMPAAELDGFLDAGIRALTRLLSDPEPVT